MANCMCSLGNATVVSGCVGEELEATWLRELWTYTFDELDCSSMVGTKRSNQMEEPATSDHLAHYRG